tara:strand:+ start:373 stop:900 length:528 start_codon:yes stop_codon:yes gene_type:complete
LNETETSQLQWITVCGAICVIVGGLMLFGGCLGLSGMDELQQLHTAIPIGEGEISDSLQSELIEHGPPMWFSRLSNLVVVCLSLYLLIQGIFLIQRDPKVPKRLMLWSFCSIIFTIVAVLMNWVPRWLLVTSTPEVEAIFLAQLLIALPMQLALPVGLIIFFNKQKVKANIAQWR